MDTNAKLLANLAKTGCVGQSPPVALSKTTQAYLTHLSVDLSKGAKCEILL